MWQKKKLPAVSRAPKISRRFTWQETISRIIKDLPDIPSKVYPWLWLCWHSNGPQDSFNLFSITKRKRTGKPGEMWSPGVIQLVTGPRDQNLRNFQVTRVVTRQSRSFLGWYRYVSMIDPGPWDWCGRKWAPSRTTWWDIQWPDFARFGKEEATDPTLSWMMSLSKLT